MFWPNLLRVCHEPRRSCDRISHFLVQSALATSERCRQRCLQRRQHCSRRRILEIKGNNDVNAKHVFKLEVYWYNRCRPCIQASYNQSRGQRHSQGNYSYRWDGFGISLSGVNDLVPVKAEMLSSVSLHRFIRQTLLEIREASLADWTLLIIEHAEHGNLIGRHTLPSSERNVGFCFCVSPIRWQVERR